MVPLYLRLHSRPARQAGERLKQSIRDLISEIWVQVEARPKQERSALVDLHFHSGVVRAMQTITQKGKLWGSNYIADFATKGKGWGLKAVFTKTHAGS